MRWKVSATLTFIALPGVLATSCIALPLVVDLSKITVSLETLQIAMGVQTTLLVVLSAIIGSTLAGQVGLSAPVITAFLGGNSVFRALRPQWLPGLVGGLIGASVIIGFYDFAPDAIRSIQLNAPIPLTVRLLYGGITEEVLVRWGLMTIIAWFGWKVMQNKYERPNSIVMWTAITLSAFIFGLSHVPVVAQSLPDLSVMVISYVTLGNAIFGLLAGYLFWRYGLEAAILAHLVSHFLAFVIRG